MLGTSDLPFAEDYFRHSEAFRSVRIPGIFTRVWATLGVDESGRFLEIYRTGVGC